MGKNMSKLNIDQKSVRELFSEKKADFLIPDYQRPYAWDEKECQTLWDDLFLRIQIGSRFFLSVL